MYDLSTSNIGNINSQVSSYMQNAKSSIQSSKEEDFQNKLKAVMDSKDKEQLKKASQELESVFINMMFKEMRSTITKSNLIEESAGRDIFESMFDEKISEQISKGKGFGLADMIYKQVLRDMENKYKIEE